MWFGVFWTFTVLTVQCGEYVCLSLPCDSYNSLALSKSSNAETRSQYIMFGEFKHCESIASTIKNFLDFNEGYVKLLLAWVDANLDAWRGLDLVVAMHWPPWPCKHAGGHPDFSRHLPCTPRWVSICLLAFLCLCLPLMQTSINCIVSYLRICKAPLTELAI